MIVMRMAITPSLNASNRLFPMAVLVDLTSFSERVAARLGDLELGPGLLQTGQETGAGHADLLAGPPQRIRALLQAGEQGLAPEIEVAVDRVDVTAVDRLVRIETEVAFVRDR